MQPYRELRPYVGRSPTAPQVEAGEMIDPPVSVPTAKPTSPAAAADAGPADDPLDPRAGFQGLRVRARNHRVVDREFAGGKFGDEHRPASRMRTTAVAMIGHLRRIRLGALNVRIPLSQKGP
jgi:hypothetical protein